MALYGESADGFLAEWGWRNFKGNLSNSFPQIIF